MNEDGQRESGARDEPRQENGFGKVRTDGFKRKLEGMLKEGMLKNFVSELKLPKEIVTHLMSQIDETKHAAVGVISREVRQFLENTDLATELDKILSKFTFEVRTTVRFIPKEEKKTPARKRKPRTKKTTA